MSAPEPQSFAPSLLEGDQELIDWLRDRCERVASPQFTVWAWEWIQEDFNADLLAQLSAAAARKSFRLRGDPGAYVDTAIRNLCRRYFRELARARMGSPIESTPESRLSLGEETVGSILAVLDIRRALGALSPRCREMIEGKYLLGYSLSELGAQQGVAEKTARSRLHSCRERLRKIWKKLST